MKVKEESEKVGLKLNIQKTKTMASSPITSWQINGETMEIVTDFIFLGSKITADCDCSHKIKRRLLLGRKVMTNLDSILKSRDITLPTKVCLVKAMVFPVVMYGCESLTIKKAECWRIDAFQPWRWRGLLRVSWTARRSNQSIPKEINPEYSLEGLMAEAEALILWPPNVRSWLTEKESDAGKEWRPEEKGATRGLDGWMASPTQWTWVWTNSEGQWSTRKPSMVQSMGSQRVGHNWANEQQKTNSDFFVTFIFMIQNKSYLP